ncbi:MAG: Pterin-4-alpha-carbinolamine dehydratase superfamily [uncultured bacterium]|nr:MAG: Pterin-4-alpha-carbinolamine dehydratase superfamily [uncultured bacterium]
MEQDLSRNVMLRKPTVQEIQALIADRNGWVIDKNRLVKEYQFADFARAIVFVNKLVNPIEERQNYPRILVTYNRVYVSLFTNEVGGITLLDFDMAKDFDLLAGR